MGIINGTGIDPDELGSMLFEIADYAEVMGLSLTIDFGNQTVFLRDVDASCDQFDWVATGTTWVIALDNLHWSLLMYGPELE